MNSMRLQTVLTMVFSVVVIGNVIQAQEVAPAPAVNPPAKQPPTMVKTNAMVARQPLYQEMRELTLKLRPAYEKLQNDKELKTAMDELAKMQKNVHQMREAKLRTDPEIAKLLDRMEVIRNQLSPKRPQAKPTPKPQTNAK